MPCGQGDGRRVALEPVHVRRGTVLRDTGSRGNCNCRHQLFVMLKLWSQPVGVQWRTAHRGPLAWTFLRVSIGTMRQVGVILRLGRRRLHRRIHAMQP